jgi:hypothetical protein
MTRLHHLAAAFGTCALVGAASADISITTGSSGTTYATSLNFDEAGGPTGAVSSTAWQSTYGITIMPGDGGDNIVQNWGNTFGPWLGDGNSLLGNFGIFMTFDSDLTAFNSQLWDPSGDGPFGGLIVAVYSGGVEVGNTIIGPSWGGVGDSWVNITAADGATFDEVRYVGLGFDPSTFADNLSWSAVPAPGAIVAFAFAGLANRRRTR